MTEILMVSAKFAILELLEIKIFQNKSYKVIISVHDTTNKVVLRQLNYVVDMAMLSNP